MLYQICGSQVCASQWLKMFLTQKPHKDCKISLVHHLEVERRCEDIYMVVPQIFFLPAGACEAQSGGPKITLHFLHLFVSLYICASQRIVCDNYIIYIVAMQPYFSQLWQFRQLLCVATMSSLAQLRLASSRWIQSSRGNIDMMM